MTDYQKLMRLMPTPSELEVCQFTCLENDNFPDFKWSSYENTIKDALQLTDELKNLRRNNNEGVTNVICGRLVNIKGDWRKKGYLENINKNHELRLTEKGKQELSRRRDRFVNSSLWNLKVSYDQFKENLRLPNKIKFCPTENKSSDRELKPKAHKVYFIRDKENGKIKIGTTGNLKSRASNLKTSSSSAQLQLLAVLEGNYDVENKVQSKFLRNRSHGEWYYPSVELYEFIFDNAEIKKELL